jgi:hypothetical protein
VHYCASTLQGAWPQGRVSAEFRGIVALAAQEQPARSLGIATLQRGGCNHPPKGLTYPAAAVRCCQDVSEVVAYGHFAACGPPLQSIVLPQRFVSSKHLTMRSRGWRPKSAARYFAVTFATLGCDFTEVGRWVYVPSSETLLEPLVLQTVVRRV